ncbi:MAG TPA: hypothetical protein VLO30_03045, partial [Chthoniobacterales bacterium]|nr:hypothetical protein [Chthoniobacterales bacterium]
LGGPTVSAGVTFKGRNAVIDFIHLTGSRFYLPLGRSRSLDISARGEIDFANLADIKLKIFPAGTFLASSPALAADDCLNRVEFYPSEGSRSVPSRKIEEIGLEGSMFSRSFTVFLPNPNSVDPPEAFPLCHDTPSNGKTLLLIAPSFFP